MHLVKEGIYDLSKLTFSLYEANDEIKDMQDTFKTMLQKINYLITEIYEKQIIVEKTRFETLQAQINPHFLYNTLTSINALARSSNQKEISTMVISLSNLLRQSIDYRNDLITVREELSIVNDFLNIQQIRYPERIYMNINIDEPIKNLMIPKFSLQPLIENSIKYNISNKRGVCHITISSLIEDNNLTLSVTDNGIGMDPYYLYRENPQIDSERTGLGLKNIHERIKMLFDANYGLSIESANNKGTTIHVTIPVVEFNKEAQLV
jgi:two-component system sensor histidine kinase YesM